MQAPVLSQRLSGIDAAFLYLERKEIPLHIAAVCILEGPVPFGEFVAAIESKLHLIPRYRQVVVAPPFNLGYPTFEDDPHFDIHQHIFRVKLPAPGGEAELEELVSHLLSQVMDRGKPLWDVHVIDGLKDGRGALLTRVHHSLADGISGASLMKVMMDPTPAGSRALRKRRAAPAPARRPERSLADVLASAVHTSLQSMIAAEEVMLDFAQSLASEQTQEAFQKLVKLLPELTASSERLPFNKPCTGDRRFCWAEFDLGEAQAVRTALGGTVNDVILSVVTRAVSRYMEFHGDATEGRFIRMVCPVNVRRDQGESMGNQITFLPVALPLDIADPAEMLHAVSERTEIMKNARAAHLAALLASWIGAAPPPLQSAFWWGLPMLPLPFAVLNMICTNVPGPPEPLYAAGKRLLSLYPHVPTGYELGVNCAVTSYDGKLQFGFTADAHVVADADRLRDFLNVSFEELARAAGLRKAHRVQKPKRKPAAKRARPAPVRAPEPAAMGATPAPAPTPAAQVLYAEAGD
jgi:diacylglycerol O-acyltransferase